MGWDPTGSQDSDEAESVDDPIVSRINTVLRNTTTSRRTYLGGVIGTVATAALSSPAAADDHGYGQGGFGEGGYGEDTTLSPGEHILTLVGNSKTVTHYHFTVAGDVTIEKSTEYDGTLNTFDTIEGTTVSGRTSAEPDSFLLGAGAELTSFSAYGPLNIYVDGQDVGRKVTEEIDGTDGDLKSEADNAKTEETAAEDEDTDDSEGEDDEDESEESTDTEGERVDESDYANVVDIVEEGADNSGTKSITSTLRRVAADDTLIRFPPGEYRMDSGVRVTNYTNLGLVGRDATIVSRAGEDTLFKLGTYKAPYDSVHVEGFTVDISRSNTGGRAFEVHANDSLSVLDITIDGEHDTANHGPLLVGVQSSSGEGLVENYDASDGGAEASGGNGGTGLLVSNYQTGTVTLRDCHIGPWPDNGIYCSNATPPSSQDGTVHVEGGFVENANVAGVRLAGDNSSIDGTEFVYDESIDGFDGQRPVRLDWGEDLVVENITIDMSGVSITEAIRVMPGVDSATIRNVSGGVSSDVRDLISVTPGAGSVETSGLDVSGFSRYDVFEY